MSRIFAGPRLVLATHNTGKLKELSELLAPRAIEIVSSDALGLPQPVEDGATFADNARIKAHATAHAADLPALADDSGLEVAGLAGAPGVHSARWAGADHDFAGAMVRIRDALARPSGSFETADRRAAFVAVICLAWPDGHEELAVGRVEGLLVDPPRGERGFGYDPMFVPERELRTFAEMPLAEKQALSHRGRAIRLLLERCFTAG